MNKKNVSLFTFLAVSLCVNACNRQYADFPESTVYNVPIPSMEESAIIMVNNLNSDGSNSLREALEMPGKRLIVFEVGGVIDLDKRGLEITEPFVVIAGQTAPSPGITIIRGDILIRTHDVMIQHIRVRPGDAGEPKKSGWAPDGISTSRGTAYHVTVDHCSISWAVDENLSASGIRTLGPDFTSHKITFSNCIIAEGLDDASHSKGRHSKGSLVHDFCRDITFVNNLFCHNARRNPYFKAYTTGAIINNLIYNPESAAIQLNYWEPEWFRSEFKPTGCRVSIVGNVLIHGQDTKNNLALVSGRGNAYLEDNLAVDCEGQMAPITSHRINILEEKPAWPEEFKPIPANEVVSHVIYHCGARPKDRDEVDNRIIRQFIEREGQIIDSQEDVGGYPVSDTTRHHLQIPKKNVDAWLDELASQLE